MKSRKSIEHDDIPHDCSTRSRMRGFLATPVCTRARGFEVHDLRTPRGHVSVGHRVPRTHKPRAHIRQRVDNLDRALRLRRADVYSWLDQNRYKVYVCRGGKRRGFGWRTTTIMGCVAAKGRKLCNIPSCVNGAFKASM